jgi:DNA (cytosine-5)-methyltransferase 1
MLLETPRTSRAVDLGAEWGRSPTGLYLPPKAEKKRFRWPIHVDLFAGAGGFGLGIHQAGFYTVAANEYDEHAALTYTVNLGTYPMQFHWVEPEDADRMERALFRPMKQWAAKRYPDRAKEIKKAKDAAALIEATGDPDVWTIGRGAGDSPMPFVTGSGWIAGERRRDPDAPPGCPHFWLGDVRKITGEHILDVLELEPGDIDLVTGGPPCQGYSVAGQRNVYDERSSLTFEFVRLCNELKPKSLVMENVPGILSMTTPDGEPVMGKVTRLLEEGGMGSKKAMDKLLREQLPKNASRLVGWNGRSHKDARDKAIDEDGEELEVDELEPQEALF